MSRPSAETIEILRNIKTEIGAGMILFPRGDAERGFNIACGRANDIITNYERGYGLFQMVRDQEDQRSVPYSRPRRTTRYGFNRKGRPRRTTRYGFTSKGMTDKPSSNGHRVRRVADAPTAPIERSVLLQQLEAAQADLRACMGGVNPQGAILAAKRVTALRATLRDTPALIAHLQGVVRG